MQSSPTASHALGAYESPTSKLLHTVAKFLIRRRILLSAILFGLIIAQDVAYGPKPHNLLNVRDPWSVIGLVMVLLGTAMRSWAAGILHKNAQLTTVGPYQLIRNPLYLGSFLMMFGFCTLLGDPKNFLIILGPVLLIYIVKVRQEERLLASRFPEQWPGYVATTPRFVPRPRRLDLSAEWRVRQWVHHREYQALLATLAALVAIQVWHTM